MYKIENAAVYAAVTSDCRTFRAKIDFVDENSHPLRTISGQDVGHITFDHAQTESDAVQIGGVLSRKAEICVCCEYLPKRGDVFKAYLYVLDTGGTGSEPATHRTIGQWSHRELMALSHRQIAVLPTTKDIDGRPLEDYFIPFGEYVVRRAAVEGSLIRVIAFDKLSKADQSYAPAIEFPASSVDVTEDVMRQLGIRHRVPVPSGNLLTSGGDEVLGSDTEEILVSAEYSFMIQETDVAGMSCRDVLGGIAAMSGGNAMLDRDGRLTVGFVDSMSYGLSADKIDAPEIGDKEQSIPGLRCIVSSNQTLTIGNADQEGAVEFSCPWMTRERLRTIWFGGLSSVRWRPANVYERVGDPCRDLGDRLTYTLHSADGRTWFDCKLLLTSIRYEFDGGLAAELTSCGTMEVI